MTSASDSDEATQWPNTGVGLSRLASLRTRRCCARLSGIEKATADAPTPASKSRRETPIITILKSIFFVGESEAETISLAWLPKEKVSWAQFYGSADDGFCD